MCGCPSDALCKLCLAGRFAQLRGVAACRGEDWADRVAREVSRDRAWPPHRDRAADVARRRVRDLTRDPVLLELLAGELAAWAARSW